MVKFNPLIEEFTINDLKVFLDSFVYDNELSQEKMIKKQYEKNNIKFDNQSLYYIDNIRRSLSFYRGMDVEKHDIDPSINRLYGGSKYYALDKESKYCESLMGYPFINEEKKRRISIKLLARLQHYNYKSRMVDITFNLAVAIYMAAYQSFMDNGKILEFCHASNKGKSRFANVLSRYHYVYNPSMSLTHNLDYMNYFAGVSGLPKPYKNYDSNPVVVIDKETFKSNSALYDLRYDAQEGTFIMFLNDLMSDQTFRGLARSRLNTSSMKASHLNYRRVVNKNKIVFLFLLAKAGVTHTTIYPDKDLSHEVCKIIEKTKIIGGFINRIDSFNRSFDDYLEEFKWNLVLVNSDILHVKSLLKVYIANEGIVQFLMTDYLRILVFRKQVIKINNTSTCNDFNESVNKLILESSESLFKYLLV